MRCSFVSNSRSKHVIGVSNSGGLYLQFPSIDQGLVSSDVLDVSDINLYSTLLTPSLTLFTAFIVTLSYWYEMLEFSWICCYFAFLSSAVVP